MYDLNGKIALITGSTSGIGREISAALIREGALVHGIGRRIERHEENVRYMGKNYTYTAIDLLQKDSITAILNDVKTLYGRLDILVNNAGIYKVATFQNHSPEDIDKILNLNLTIPIQIYRAVLDLNIPEQALWIASRAGLGHYPYESVYETAKHGLKSFVLSVAQESKYPRHVVVYPGFVLTELTGQLDNLPDDIKNELKEELAIKDAGVIVQPVVRMLKSTSDQVHISFIPNEEGVHMHLLKPVQEELRDFVIEKSELLTKEVIPLLR